MSEKATKEKGFTDGLLIFANVYICNYKYEIISEPPYNSTEATFIYL